MSIELNLEIIAFNMIVC